MKINNSQIAWKLWGVTMMKKLVLSGRKIFMLVMVCCKALAFALLSLAMQGISMGVAYAIWMGSGACGGVLVGILFFAESRSAAKLFFIGVIIASAVGFKLLG